MPEQAPSIQPRAEMSSSSDDGSGRTKKALFGADS
jgi:hypothetical protein